MVTNSGNSTRSTIGTLIHQGMKQIGLDVDYQIIDFGDLVYRLTLSYDWEAVIIELTGGSDPGSGYNVWHSSGHLHLWNPNQTQPATDWEAKIDGLFIRASQESRLCAKSRQIIRTG